MFGRRQAWALELSFTLVEQLALEFVLPCLIFRSMRTACTNKNI